MTERERLIELLHKGELSMWGKSFGGVKEQREALADFLLEHGVIVPPCKVGDTVYRITPNYLFKKEYDVVGFHLGNFPTLNGHKRKPYLVCYDKTSRYLAHLPIEEIGKAIFLTHEEAERAIEERRKHK